MSTTTIHRDRLRAITAIATALIGVAFILGVVAAGQALAHTPDVDVDCAGITVTGRAYEAGATLELTVNGVTQTQAVSNSGNFAGLSASFTGRGDNAWSYQFVNPADHRYDSAGSGVTEGCDGPTTTTTTTSSTTTTTTEAPPSTTFPTTSVPDTSTSSAPPTSTPVPSTTPPAPTVTSPPSSVPSTPAVTPPVSSSTPPGPCVPSSTFDPADPDAGLCWQLVATL